MLKQCAFPLNFLKCPTKKTVTKHRREKKLNKVKKFGLGKARVCKGVRFTKGGRRFHDHMKSVSGETDGELLELYETAVALVLSSENGVGGGRNEQQNGLLVRMRGEDAGQRNVGHLIAPNGELLVESDFGDEGEEMDDDEERSAGEEMLLY